MSVVYVISDTHFGHKNICHYRKQFSSMEQHDQLILNNILETVKKRDTLWMLGDCFFQEHTIDYAKAISDSVQHLNFIPGNHDSDNTERLELLKKMINMGLFHKVGSMFKIGGFWLTHPPIHPAELRGKPNIHGHVHFATVMHERRIEHSPFNIEFVTEPDPNYVNVCCENVDYKPINFQLIKAGWRSYE